MTEQRIQQQFFESADLLYQAAEQLARPLAMAGQMVVEAITGGNRILCAGHGLASMEADYLAARLAGRFEQERGPGGAVTQRRHVDAHVVNRTTTGRFGEQCGHARQVQLLQGGLQFFAQGRIKVQ